MAPHLKQLLYLKSTGQTLIEHCINAVLGCYSLQNPLTVVLGAEANRIKQHIPALIADNSCDFIINNNHKKGLSSSIAHGIEHLFQQIGDQGFSVLLLLVDQFEVNSRHLDQLMELHLKSNSKNPITASAYGENNIGPPVIFSSRYLPELTTMTEGNGAKSVISRHQEQLQTLSNPEFKGIDLDTIEDIRAKNSRINP